MLYDLATLSVGIHPTEMLASVLKDKVSADYCSIICNSKKLET